MEELNNLRERRIKKNLSQIEIAKLIGVTANAYRNWEYGANEPSEENMAKLKEVLDKEGE
jgi:transcriptional regulator with XRE-family HTH domain